MSYLDLKQVQGGRNIFMTMITSLIYQTTAVYMYVHVCFNYKHICISDHCGVYVYTCSYMFQLQTCMFQSHQARGLEGARAATNVSPPFCDQCRAVCWTPNVITTSLLGCLQAVSSFTRSGHPIIFQCLASKASDTIWSDKVHEG